MGIREAKILKMSNRKWSLRISQKESKKDYLRDFTGVGTAGLGVAVLASDGNILADGLANLVKVDEGRGDNDLCFWGWEMGVGA